MAYIKGDDVFLYIVVDGVNIPVACLINNPLSEVTEPLETTSRGNNGFRSYIPTIQDYNIEISGHLFIGVGMISYNDLRILKREGAVFEWRIVSLSTHIAEKGRAFISSLSIDSPSGGIVSFNASLTPSTEGLTHITFLWSQNGENVVTQNGSNLIIL